MRLLPSELCAPEWRTPHTGSPALHGATHGVLSGAQDLRERIDRLRDTQSALILPRGLPTSRPEPLSPSSLAAVDTRSPISPVAGVSYPVTSPGPGVRHGFLVVVTPAFAEHCATHPIRAPGGEA